MISLPKAAFPLLLGVTGLGAAPAALANPMAGTVSSVPAAVVIPADIAATPPAIARDTALTAYVPDASGPLAPVGPGGITRKSVLPEPATIAVLGIGLLGLGFLRRTRAR